MSMDEGTDRSRELLRQVASLVEAAESREDAQTAAPQDLAYFPPQPDSFEELGVSETFVAELLLKELHFMGRLTSIDASRALGIGYSLAQQALEYLKRETLIQRVGSQGLLEQSHVFSLTERGRDEAERTLSRNRYRGRVPVPLEQYVEVVKKQSLHNQSISRSEIEKGLSHLVLDPGMIEALGPAVNSGHSMLLFGPPGNGKTSIAIGVGRLLGRLCVIPAALYVSGQIITVFDPTVHQPVTDYQAPESLDKRWVVCTRPTIVAGGELTMERLDLQRDPALGYSQAPLQMKANGGVLLIDDFGRQRIPARDLLNRWIVPMDRNVDYLTLNTGETIEVPFDLLLILATNLRLADLIDEAFLRRVRYKIQVSNPREEEFRRILRTAAARKNLDFDEEMLDYFIGRHYRKTGKEMRACQGPDLINYVLDICRFEGCPPTLKPEILDVAAANLF